MAPHRIGIVPDRYSGPAPWPARLDAAVCPAALALTRKPKTCRRSRKQNRCAAARPTTVVVIRPSRDLLHGDYVRAKHLAARGRSGECQHGADQRLRFSSGIQWAVPGTRRPATCSATSRIISSTSGPEVLLAPAHRQYRYGQL
jgi:hypothetical protein